MQEVKNLTLQEQEAFLKELANTHIEGDFTLPHPMDV